MTREEIIEKLTPIARTIFENQDLVLADDMSADNVATWTSLAFMQFLTEIENQFGFKFKMMELFNLKTMGNIIASITVQQVRDWLKTGVGERGLSEELISRTRAWSIIHNPYATDDLNIVSAIFVNDEVAAYTHLFPDESRGERIYWNTTLYCNPKYEGRGYAAIVIGQFCEIYGERYFDLDAVQESIANLKFNGLTVEYVPQYILSNKAITRNTFKSKLARLREQVALACKTRKSALICDIKATDYRIKYAPFVSDDVFWYAVLKVRTGEGENLRFL